MKTEINYNNIEIDFGNGITRSANSNKIDLQSGAKLSEKITQKKSLDFDGVFSKSEIEEIEMIPVKATKNNLKKLKP